MKYEKPRERDLSDVSLAGGNCASGNFVGTCLPNGKDAGSCVTVGQRAGTCGPGTTVGGSGAVCSPGAYATISCATGDTAV